MIIDCISDLHGSYPELTGGDLLILAGDYTARDRLSQWAEFFRWLKRQLYEKKVLVAGNHDGFLARGYPQSQQEAHQLKEVQEFLEQECSEEIDHDFEYLCDSGCEFGGLKIWGSPWTPEFCNWHFMLPGGDAIKAKWDLIPDDTDILITHSPSFGVLDEVKNRVKPKFERRLGCAQLREAVERVEPGLHVFGHIHGGYGTTTLKHEGSNTLCVNAAFMNDDYEPVNAPICVHYSHASKKFRPCDISDH